MTTKDGAAGAGELTSWDATSKAAPKATPVARPARERRRLRKFLLIGGGALLVLLVVLVALAPTIAGSMAPGIIEGSVNPDIKGKVKVARVGMGWFSGIEAGPIDVLDPNGALAARVELKTPVTLWQALSGRYWSARSLDLGTIEVAGKADLMQYDDGTTNLDRAFAPTDEAKARPRKPAGTPGASKPLPSIKATVKLTRFDASVRNEKDKFAGEIGVKQLAGEAKIDADLSAPGGGMVKALADFTGNAVTPGGAAAGESMALKLDADVKQTSAGKWTPDGIDRAKVKLGLTNAPIGVVDALASMGGALVQGIGNKADVTADIDGNAQQMTAIVKVASAGLNADANLAIEDGVLTTAAGKPTTLSLRSTEFLQELPQTRAGVTNAARQIRLTAAPSVEISLDSLRLPIGKGAGSAGMDVKTLDFRGASLGLNVKVSGMSGQVLLGGAGLQSGGSSATVQEGTATWKPFAVEPLELTINIPDLAKPVSIATGTKATLDGQPAGDISVTIDADGLLDENGRLRATTAGKGIANRADAAVRITGMSTALVQPIFAGAMKGLPIDLPQDVGPTLDMNLLAKADVAAVKDAGAVGKGGLETLPPTDITATINSKNIKANMVARLDKAVLTTSGDGIRLTVDSAAPLAQRIARASRDAQMNAAPPGRDPKAAAPPEITLTGAGKVELTARDVVLALNDTAPEAIIARGKGAANLVISDLNASVNMGGNTSPPPVRIDRQAVALTLAPGSAPKIDVDGKLSHESQPFTITGGYTLDGLKNGIALGNGPGALARLNPNGTLEIKSLPRSILGILPATAPYAAESGVPATADAMARAIAAMVRESLGATIDASVKLAGAAGGAAAAAAANPSQLVNLKVSTAGASAGKGATIDLAARVSEKEAEIAALAAKLPLDPRALNPVLAAAMAPKPGAAAPTGTQAPPMALGAPVAFTFTIDKPVSIPFAADATGAVAPDWARAGELLARVQTDGDLVIQNISMGGGGKNAQGEDEPIKLGTAALRQLVAEIKAPLAGIPDEARGKHRATIKASAIALDRTSGEAQIAKLTVDAVALMNGQSPDATVKLSEVNTAAVENVLGQKDLVVGALGDSAEVTLRVTPGAGGGATGAAAAGEVISVVAEVTSPRISGAKLSLAKDDTHIWITQPSAITWTPNAAFINKFLLGGTETTERRRERGNRPNAADPAPAADQPASLTLDDIQPITINIAKLAAAVGGSSAEAAAATGPLKPGVFELDVSVNAPSLGMNLAPSQPGQAATKLTLEGVRINATSPRAAAGATGAGPIEVNMNIERVGGAGAQAGKRSTARVEIANLADARGVIAADKSVINADVDIAAFPTPIVDNLAQQKGLLTELLGPTVTLQARARNVSKGGGGRSTRNGQPAASPAAAGDLTVEANSQRATAKIKGDVKDGRFVQTGPVTVEVREIRNQLVQVLAGSIPIIETLEKTPPDEPATLGGEGLIVPLDNNLRNLNGKLTVDMGIARFTTNSLLGELIKGLGGRESGTVGKKIEKFVVNIKDGVATYDRFRLPVGEFFLETRGTIDLVQRKIDVVTYAPIGALTDKAIGKLGSGITNRLNEVLQVPFTTKGSMDNPDRLYPDVGLFFKEAGENLLKEPGKIIDSVIGDLLKPKPKK